MERKPDSPAPEALRGALLRLAVAHNRAVLAGVTLAVGAGAIACGTGLALGAGSRLVALPLVLVGVLIGWKGVRLHGRLIRDLGPGRAAAAAVLGRALDGGASEAPLEALEAAVGAADLERGLEFLARIGVGRLEEEAPGGPAGPRLVVDRARVTSLIDRLDRES